MNKIQKSPAKLGDFIPLIVIFSVIIAFTLLRQLYFGVWSGTQAMQDFMGSFFLVFGAFKIMNWKGFAQAYAMYDIVAKRSRGYAYLYPLIEIGLGLAYFIGLYLSIVNWITLLVMLVSSIGVGKELLKKNQIPCACLGVVFKIPMTKVTLFEDLLMAAMALLMIVI